MTGLDSPLAAIAEAVRAGEVSALELTEAALARIAERDGPVNSVVVRDDERAIGCRGIERSNRRARGSPDPGEGERGRRRTAHNVR